MDRTRFLTQQYEQMISTGDFVVEQWRSSMDRFIHDMWDRTPIWANRRRLEPIDPSLGFSPDNVEWHFRPVKKKTDKGRKPKAAAPQKPKPMAPPKPKRLTKAERKAEQLALRDAKREALAEEFRQWEREMAASKQASSK